MGQKGGRQRRVLFIYLAAIPSADIIRLPPFDSLFALCI